ncbi:MAG: DJ-1/PfpI family protein [Lachnospiraceae bacterium]|nr:DJ-1/PfpI family protein [Lachnospiraceae bacterium]
MKRAAVLFADGFEEIEGLTIVDVLRRAGAGCDMIGLDALAVTGSHGVTVIADRQLGDIDMEEITAEYDMIVLPGGLPGAENLRDDRRVIRIIKSFAADPEKFIAAICAGPISFGKAGVISGRRVTSYPDPDVKAQLPDAVYVDDETVVSDGNIITSRGPATALKFAYTLVNALGIENTGLEKKMLFR